MKRIIAVFFLFSTFFLGSADNRNNQIKITKAEEINSVYYYNGHTYILCNKNTSWIESKKLCEKAGGYLVVIDNWQENANIRKIIKRNTWIGLYYDQDSHKFMWVTGKDTEYTYWHRYQPDHSGIYPIGVYYASHLEYKWDDMSSTEKYDFICEFDYIIKDKEKLETIINIINNNPVKKKNSKPKVKYFLNY